MGQTITSLRLSNGLQVLLKEIHTAPIISQWVWYRVGSRDEHPGITGISHWNEHMLFKGTPRFPAKVLDKAISRLGGQWNALTSQDWTAYYETMPAETFDLTLELEADRMQHGIFEPEEVELERTVILSERQGSENEPLFRLSEEVTATAFRVHPYHHEVIGDTADLLTIQRDDLYQHYRTYYLPNNAVLAVAGDFDHQAMLARIQELFESIPGGPEPSRTNRQEPPQTGERQVVVEGPGDTTYMQLVYHVPAANHPDFIALMVLDSLLSGPSGASISGGGLSNKTSRLYRALVEGELAISISGGLQASIDPYLYTLLLILHPGRKAEDIVTVVQSEIQRLQDAPPPANELARAVKQARALFAYGMDSITSQAFWLGYSEMFASYAWFENYLDRLATVTPEDVQRVAQVYLRRQNCTRGTYLPDSRSNAP